MVASGASFLQLEDLGAWLPLFSGNPDDFGWVVDVINKTIDGVEAKLAWHFCFGAAWGNASQGLFPSGAGYGSILAPSARYRDRNSMCSTLRSVKWKTRIF